MICNGDKRLQDINVCMYKEKLTVIVVFWARTAGDSYRGLKTSGTLHDCNEESSFLVGHVSDSNGRIIYM